MAVLSIQASAPATDLAVGGTVQLVVRGTFDDGSEQDITNHPSTRFSASPEEVLKVSAGGLVTAVGAGDGFVQVDHGDFYGFAADAVQFRARVPGDRDADGMPDEYETTHAFDPDFAGDAGQDPDQDGLSNLEELAAGTDPRLGDTDGDWASDGLEVSRGTDPLSGSPPEPDAPEEPLDETCVVSALNRSARVQPDGVWVLPNVPANSGLVRVRATCIDGEGTRSGQSDFFPVPANGTIEVADIRFDQPEPVPTGLVLSAPTLVLTSVGESVQMAATATYPDGSVVDVSAPETGTGYTSSNAAIAEVDAGGLVLANVSGTVLISALNEGALGVLRLQVVLSGDSDGDGLPDDFELANGLDPNNPLDVLDDPDGDGLSTGDEFPFGLDPFDRDSDDDGLGDGDEVTRHGTDPLLFDTDGDGISDGLEVTSGSDPLDPTSFNLAPILEGLEVYPAAFDLVFNTVEGEASRRLEVTGRLIDGTSLDLRSSRYGTSYTSSDLTIAGFGTEDGRIFAGRNGTAVVTATVAGASAVSEVSVTSFAPTALSFLRLSGFPNGVDVDSGYAYVAAGRSGLQVVDVFDPRRPALLGSYYTGGNANDVWAEGTYAYVAAGSAGLVVMDVSDPRAAFVAGRLNTAGDATDLVVTGDRVFVADGSAGVVAVDVSDPGSPRFLGSVDTPGTARGIDAVDDLVLVADADGGLVVIDASDPTAMSVAGSTPTRESGSRAADVVVRGRLAYVADGAWNLGGLRVVDFSQPQAPFVVATTGDAFGLVDLALEDRFILAADYFFRNGVPIFDAGASPPLYSAVVDFSRAPSFRDDNGNGVAVEGGIVYMVGVYRSILDNGTVGSGGLHIGRYRRVQDLEGVAPSVEITAPISGTSILERRLLTVRAEVSDDIGVRVVRLLVDGVVVEEDFRAPYEWELTAPAGGVVLSLEVEAEDLGGNVGYSEAVSLDVVPDGEPVVELLSPTAFTSLVEGGIVDVVAAASDDSAVSAVDFVIDGEVAASFTTPPYRLQHPLTIGAVALQVEVRATDDASQTATTGVQTFAVADDLPPTVEILQPEEQAEVVEASFLRVDVGAGDDLGVVRVDVLVDGVETAEDITAPFGAIVRVPAGVTETVLQARAVDNLGQESLSAVRTVSVVPDPGTTVTGRVEIGEAGVGGAVVSCQGVSGVSGPDGTFSIPGVATISAEISCAASYTDAGGTPFAGTSLSVVPVPADLTDVGPFELVESLFEPELGPSLNLADDQAAFRDLPFTFPFFGSSYSGVWINTNGNFTFVEASPTDWTEDADEFVSGFRDLDGLDVGPTIALFWDDLEPVPGDVPAERDLFRFDGALGDVVAVEIFADRDGSPLDPMLTLYDAAGSALGFNDDFSGLDSRIDLTLPADGVYYVEVEDFAGQGSAEYFYRLVLEGNGAPITDRGQEVEPNDGFATATVLTYGDSVTGVLDADATGPTRNLHVNAQIPGRFIVTWNDVPEYPGVGSNTAQAILFEDGRIQFGYDGLTSDDALVGVSPANDAQPLIVDFTADAPFASDGALAIFEEFDGPVGPDGTGEDPPGDRPVDLDGRVVMFTPNADGGFDVGVFGSPTSVSGQGVYGSRVAAAATVGRGSLRGRLLPDGTASTVGLEALVTSSTQPDLEILVVVDQAGRFEVHDLPAGGVNVVASRGGVEWRAAGILEGVAGLDLTLRPTGAKPKSD